MAGEGRCVCADTEGEVARTRGWLVKGLGARLPIGWWMDLQSIVHSLPTVLTKRIVTSWPNQ